MGGVEGWNMEGIVGVVHTRGLLLQPEHILPTKVFVSWGFWSGKYLDFGLQSCGIM